MLKKDADKKEKTKNTAKPKRKTVKPKKKP